MAGCRAIIQGMEHEQRPCIDPEAVWSTWCRLVTDLVRSGVTKSRLTILSGLKPSTGRQRSLNRYVLYPDRSSWSPPDPTRSHLKSMPRPWSSVRASMTLLAAMLALASDDVAVEHPEIAERAKTALAELDAVPPSSAPAMEVVHAAAA